MKQKWGKTQYIELTMDELFVWWDWLDSLNDTPEKAFDLFTKFLEQCEDQLEFDPDFIDRMNELEEKDEWVHVDCLDDLFDDDKEEEVNLPPSTGQTLKEQYDVPFMPRHDF